MPFNNLGGRFIKMNIKTILKFPKHLNFSHSVVLVSYATNRRHCYMYKSFIHCWAALATPLLTAHRPRCYNCMSRFLNLTRKIIEIAFLYFIQPRIGTLNMNCFHFTYVFCLQILDYPFPKIKILSFFIQCTGMIIALHKLLLY